MISKRTGYVNQSHSTLHPEDGGSTVLRNTGVVPQHYMTSQPRIPRLESSLPENPKPRNRPTWLSTQWKDQTKIQNIYFTL